MKTFKSLFFALIVLTTTSMAQIVVSGVKVPSKLDFSGSIRELNGAGTRIKFTMHVYVAALYLTEKSKDPKVIINADKPMSVRLQIISSLLTSEAMAKYIREGFSRSLDGKIEPYKEHIDLICEVFKSEPTKVGDVYDIHYTPGVGITVSKNAKPFDFSKFHKNDPNIKLLKLLGHTKEGFEAIPGLDFKKAIWGIWFSNDPVDEDLKDEMLGINVL